MKLRKRGKFSSANLLALATRAKVLDRSELLDNLETALSLLGRYVSEYRRTREARMLAEAKMSAEAVYAMADELLGRDEPPPLDDDDGTPKLEKLQKARQMREHY